MKSPDLSKLSPEAREAYGVCMEVSRKMFFRGLVIGMFSAWAITSAAYIYWINKHF